ncbi:hypothetical protein Q3G72_031761 [Acer saccharum]|nr:hypothetical protein Q3G72_031761 [Acer saccharum]
MLADPPHPRGCVSAKCTYSSAYMDGSSTHGHFVSVFADGGAIIDFGTSITRLQPEAYAALKSAFHKEMSRYKLLAPDPEHGNIENCYDFSIYENETVVIPNISFIFKGRVKLEVNVKAEGDHAGEDAKLVCFAFIAAGDEDGAILGNLMQRTIQDPRLCMMLKVEELGLVLVLVPRMNN